MKEDLLNRFEQSMKNVYIKAKKEVNYNAKIYWQMINSKGGLQTAHDLINSKKIPDGYANLLELNRLDLTMEAMIWKNSEFYEFFSEKQMRIIKKRLKK